MILTTQEDLDEIRKEAFERGLKVGEVKYQAEINSLKERIDIMRAGHEQMIQDIREALGQEGRE